MLIIDIKKLADDIDLIEEQIHDNATNYMMDSDCKMLVDTQLNGYITVLKAYCLNNTLLIYANEINAMILVDGNAITFFCLWDNIKLQILEHTEKLQGKKRTQVVTDIAYKLQSKMKKRQIDTYLSGFGIDIVDDNDIVPSNRVYVEHVLKDADGITLWALQKI